MALKANVGRMDTEVIEYPNQAEYCARQQIPPLPPRVTPPLHDPPHRLADPNLARPRLLRLNHPRRSLAIPRGNRDAFRRRPATRPVPREACRSASEMVVPARFRACAICRYR